VWALNVQVRVGESTHVWPRFPKGSRFPSPFTWVVAVAWVVALLRVGGVAKKAKKAKIWTDKFKDLGTFHDRMLLEILLHVLT
jgi:hypothetical protein